MSSPFFRACVASSVLFACTPKLDLAAQGQFRIACGSTAECPVHFHCEPEIARCYRDNTEPPEQGVVFVSPLAGETNVPINVKIVIAFAFDVDVTTLAGFATLSADDGVPLEVSFEATPVANTARLIVARSLSARTHYTLSFAAGIAAAPGIDAAVSKSTSSSDFVTADAIDLSASGAVSDVLVDHRSDKRIELSWKNPSNRQFAGVLILRHAGGPVAAVPSAGAVYGAGQMLGEDEVVAETNAEQFSDPVATSASYGYAFFAFDGARNYGSASAPPFVASVSLQWCPSETGSFTVSSPDALTQQLRLVSQTAVAFDLPFGGEPANTASALSIGGDLSLRTVYVARGLAKNAHGASLSRPIDFVTSSALPATRGQPVPVRVGGTAVLRYTGFDWASFDGEVDTVASAADGSEIYDSAGVISNPAAVSAAMAVAGNYRLRVRAKAAGCPDAGPWVTSEPFSVGDGYYYVVPGGAGAKTGADPQDALPSIAAATGLINATPGQYAVFVSAGTYNEVVTLPANTMLLGGYSLDFVRRDPQILDPAPKSLTSLIAPRGLAPTLPETNRHAVIIAGGDAGSVVDGFTLSPDASVACAAPGSAACYPSAVWVQNRSSPTIRNNHILGVTPENGRVNRSVFLDVSLSPKVIGNLIEGGGGGDSNNFPAGVQVYSCAMGDFCQPRIADNRIIAHVAVDIQGNTSYVFKQGLQRANLQPIVEGNTLFGDPSSPNGYPQTIVRCAVTANMTLIHNLVVARRNKLDFASQDTIAVSSRCAGRIDGNRLDGGDGYNSTSLLLTGACSQAGYDCDISITNNLISAGTGPASARGLSLTGGYTPFEVTNNVIYVSPGGATERTAITLSNDVLNNPPSPVVANNIFFGAGVREWLNVGGSRIVSLLNNVALSPPPQHVMRTSANADSFSALETTYCPLAAAPVIRASDNLDSALTAGDVFASPGGTDGKIETLDDNDWQLLPGAIKDKMGVDASQSICGGTCASPDAVTSCGGVSEDLTGVARTPPFSVGAYR